MDTCLGAIIKRRSKSIQKKHLGTKTKFNSQLIEYANLARFNHFIKMWTKFWLLGCCSWKTMHQHNILRYSPFSHWCLRVAWMKNSRWLCKSSKFCYIWKASMWTGYQPLPMVFNWILLYDLCLLCWRTKL